MKKEIKSGLVLKFAIIIIVATIVVIILEFTQNKDIPEPQNNTTYYDHYDRY